MTNSPPNSSPCGLPDTDPAYNGFLTLGEIQELLLSLLHAERAGARVCTLSLVDAVTEVQRQLLVAIHDDEVASCKRLMHAMRSIGAAPDQEVGDFVEKCMEIHDFTARLQFLNRGQRWVARKITEALPKIPQEAVLMQLTPMLRDHERNIAALDAALEAGGSASPDETSASNNVS
ncbi:DUF6306 domain-containing protein [Kineobactrum salinum]|uniref:DUF6306 domain-containing protein n=1 Tax=Kineobactrum salinum TaxID=2708301 RepID=A0A6C0U3N4_9GAMM|nr:DUF6306 domain-containing protein [Kineobactrum salinum]QIB66548.1 hypothetical protein G3T16_15235 [Kineobactrum salinum]